MYAHLITVTGWTWEYIDEYMTFPRLETLSDYWQQHPPTHLLMANFVGHKPQSKPKNISKQKKENDFNELMQIFGQAGGKVIKHGREGQS